MEQTRPKETPSCPRCGGKLRLRPGQRGTEVICPKCSHRFVVGQKPPPPPPRRTKPIDESYQTEVPVPRSTIFHEEVPESEDSTIVVDPEPAYPEEYEPEIPLTPSFLGAEQLYSEIRYEGQSPAAAAGAENADFEYEAAVDRPAHLEQEYLAIAKAKGLLDEKHVADPPPRWLFLSGVFTFPFQGRSFLRWLVLSLMMWAATPFVAGALQLIFGKAALGFTSSMIVAAVGLLGSMTGMFAAACFVAAIQDTSDGFREVQVETFPEFRDWMPLLLGLLNVLLLSGALGYPLIFVPQIGPIAVPISMAVFFPIVVLSAMEASSYFVPLSPVTWSLLPRYARTWLMFYLLSTLIVGGWLAAVWFGLARSPNWTLMLAGPALAYVVLIYGRLLGRVAWRMSDPDRRSTRGYDAPGDRPDEPTEAPAPRRRRRSKRRRVSAAELDAAANYLSDKPSSPPAADRRVG